MKRFVSLGVAVTILAACTAVNAPDAPTATAPPGAGTIVMSRQPGGPSSIRLIDLGTLPGGSPSFANAINSGGVIAGQSYTGANYGGVQHAVRWQESTPGSWVITDLSGQLTGSTMSAADGINGSGDVVGWMRTSNGEDHAFLLTSGGALTVISLTGRNASYASDVSDAGGVVGYTTSLPDPYGNNTRAFYYGGGTGVELPTLSGTSAANAIADDGTTIVGYSYDAARTQHAVAWTRDAAGAWTIAKLAGSANAAAEAINTNGNVAGSGCPNLTTNGCPGARAYDWASAATNPTVMETLGGAVSAAYGIDDSGRLAGWSTTRNGVQHAFFAASATSALVDLGSLAGKNGGSKAAALNGNGRVVGWSQLSGPPSTGGHATLWILP
jgi:probable HAF family extracellular repeat protein